MSHVLIVALSAFALLVAAQLAVVQWDGQRRRRQRIARASGGPAAAPVAAGRKPGRALISALRRILVLTAERAAILSGAEAEKSAVLLTSAGFRSRDALLIYSFLKLVLPVGLVVLATPWLWFTGIGRGTPALSALIVISAAIAISKAPDWILSAVARRRADAIRRSFPDMLELLVVTSESGLSPLAAMRRVASELDDGGSVLGAELRQLVVELNMLAERRTAYANFEERVPLAEVTLFVNTLEQADRFGTSFATAMRTLMTDMRAHILLRAEERAARLPAILTVPLILFIMPVLLIILIGPAALAIIDNIVKQ
ncbi:type II secretion system F family protein [Solirhodobacter olei]|uniref:type II secretion system F family protein n=1 Tax=Solirhodobacter olei TaxID=2493082 RepID=UPI000FDB3968|nr:type II secretion system F family protein [Solirhodobacter olei]